ncbi:hypothetical protein NT652_17770, partial [Enterobacter hormaechei]|nr:hypothetical protein [Enterobacter hormaechei]
MRILMIIDGLPGGGAEKTVLTLSSGLTELGHQVTLFSLRKVCDGNDSNLLIVFYVQIMPDDFVMQLHR